MADEALLLDTKAGLEEALKLPSFQLNVRNQNTNRYLIVILIAQLVTNIALIGISLDQARLDHARGCWQVLEQDQTTGSSIQ